MARKIIKKGNRLVEVEAGKPETASVKPPENAMMPKAKAKKLGGGWFELPSGEKVRKSELKEGEIDA